MRSPAREEADAALAEFAGFAEEEFDDAARDASAALMEHMRRFEDEDGSKAAMVAAGALSAAAWAAWRRSRVFVGPAWREAVGRAAGAMVDAGTACAAAADELRGRAYREALDWCSYVIELATGDLQPRADPSEEPSGAFSQALQEGKRAAWNARKVSEAVQDGIARGLSIPQIAGSMERVAGMNRACAVRAARTAVTSAEGRAAMDRAASHAGRSAVRLEWIAALDSRTRGSHRSMDGQKRDPGKPFSNGLRFPADPKGHPREVYNCRCALGYDIDGFSTADVPRASRLAGMSYEDWRAGKRPTPSEPRKTAPAPRPKPAPVPKPEKPAPAPKPQAAKRAELVAEARAIYVEAGGHAGLTREEAELRFAALIGGNSDAELRKYIARHGGGPAKAAPRKPAKPSARTEGRPPAKKKGGGRGAAKQRPLTRGELEAKARELYRLHGNHMGLSEREAMRRFDALVGAQSDARLRKEIAKYEAEARRKKRARRAT